MFGNAEAGVQFCVEQTKGVVDRYSNFSWLP